MASRRPRLVATAGVLALLLVGGVGWLVRVAMEGASQSTLSVAPISSAPISLGGTPAGSAVAPGPGHPTVIPTAPRPPATKPSKTTGPRPPTPVHSIAVSGPLGGGVMDDSCRLFTNTLNIRVTLKAIALSQSASNLVLEHTHCPAKSFQFITDLKPCAVADDLKPGGTCYTGVELAAPQERSENSELHQYSAGIILTLQAVCTGVDLAPCSDGEVARLRPSPGNPVRIRWQNECPCEVHRSGWRESPQPTETATQQPTPLATT
jgi:hypothetical protein